MATTSKRNGDTMLHQGELTVVSCWCGIKHAIPSALYKHAKSDSDNHVFCPLGHKFVYRDSDADVLRREKAVLERRLANAESREEVERAEKLRIARSNAALRGHLTRWKRRVSNGVCPVASCKRHFPNVQHHVETMHKDWLAEHPEVFDAE